MKLILKITVVVGAIFLMVPEADGVFGVRRRTAVVVATETEAADSAKVAQSQQQTAAAQQQTAAAQQQTASAQQQATAAKPPGAAAPTNPPPAAAKPQAPAAPPAPPPAAAGAPLPLGTVVTTLPPGCVSTPVGGVEYYYGGGNFYRAVFQGNSLVYVTAQP
jgi:hypothetical protein